MEFKDYQQKVLDCLDIYLHELAAQRIKSGDQIRKLEEIPDIGEEIKRGVLDFPKKAWDTLKANGVLPGIRAAVPYSPRLDGLNRPVPNICLKIPTGGGKTFLAASAVSRIMGKYLSRNTGFVLWIVPNEAIYTQTKKHLSNRDHPYRQILDRAAAGRVKLMEKDHRLDKRDVDSHLCVMLLMLQSANRETKETLRLFRDRGNVHGFFPPSDDFNAHFELLREIPTLDTYGGQGSDNLGSIAKDSLGNVLRYIRPVVVMDEGHRAYTARALDTLYGFNPCFVLELSATPKDRPADKPPRYANWLVDVRGKELAEEDMIKLPINVKVKAGDDWRDCLRESLELLNSLQDAADTHRANSSSYIRPIMLVQVERTGKDQIESGLIHAEQVKDFLLTAGLAEREIAIKTSDTNDLKEPENQDLLSPANTVRVIITKQALQEGWDCPFAYVLCTLSANRNMSAMTQLVGRIMRQPYAAKTGSELIDECYVLCHHAETREVVEGIKKGLEEDGMADLAKEIRDMGEGNGKAKQKRKIPRRDRFKELQIFLPEVNWAEGETVRPLDYEQDVLLGLDWSEVSMEGLAGRIPADESHVIFSQMTSITMADGSEGEFFTAEPTKRLQETATFDPVYATRMIADIVSNPWVARELVGELVGRLKARGFDDGKLGAMSSFILEELRKDLNRQRDELAERQFFTNVKSERIQFRLRTDSRNWKMPYEIETELPEGAKKLYRKDGNLTDKSLFAPVYQDDYNTEEENFACYLDEREALQWWHRNVVKAGQYSLQGWRKHKIYPDFLFALTTGEGRPRVVVIETKGEQLGGNLDTEYKRKLLQLMSENYRHEKVMKAGELEIVVDNGTSVSCDLVLMEDWPTKIPQYFD